MLTRMKNGLIDCSQMLSARVLPPWGLIMTKTFRFEYMPIMNKSVNNRYLEWSQMDLRIAVASTIHTLQRHRNSAYLIQLVVEYFVHTHPWLLYEGICKCYKLGKWVSDWIKVLLFAWTLTKCVSLGGSKNDTRSMWRSRIARFPQLRTRGNATSITSWVLWR